MGMACVFAMEIFLKEVNDQVWKNYIGGPVRGWYQI